MIVDWGAAAQWAGIIIIGGGLIFTVRQNGKSNIEKDVTLKTELKQDIGTIKERLDDADTGLSAIKGAVDDQKLTCAKISTEFKTKIGSNEENIRDLKRKR